MTIENYCISEKDAGQRIDAWLHQTRPDVSRSRWQSLLKAGNVLLDGQRCKPSHALRAGEKISVEIPPPQETELVPEDIPFNILYEDSHLLVLDKPAGLVVHPAAGHASGTLVNAILHHCGDLQGIGGELRPGIVHRLDKDTSGVMVVAKTEQAMVKLSDQFKRRQTEKEYSAIVWGVPNPTQGRIETEIGRSRGDRKRMSVATARGRKAVSNYEVVEDFGRAALVKVVIETGRTHQIRVHMAHIGHPVVGDKTYGGKRGRLGKLDVSRQMLHARRLVFTHPESGEKIESIAPIPEDMRKTIEQVRSHSD